MKKIVLAQNMTEENSIVRALNIMIVEDNEVCQLLALHVLENMGHTISIAGNGEQCIELLAVSTYDCIFMDIQMPLMDGLETATFIRRTLKKDIPIIGMSAAIYEEDKQKSLHAGMNDHIEKIYTESIITDILAKWVR